MFEFDTRERDGVLVLSVQGSLDAMTSSSLKAEVAVLAEKHLKVVVDLGGLTLIDSTGVGTLISLFKRVRARGGHVYFAALQSQPREVFRLLRLDRSLDLFDTVDAAVDKIQAA